MKVISSAVDPDWLVWTSKRTTMRLGSMRHDDVKRAVKERERILKKRAEKTMRGTLNMNRIARHREKAIPHIIWLCFLELLEADMDERKHIGTVDRIAQNALDRMWRVSQARV